MEPAGSSAPVSPRTHPKSSRRRTSSAAKPANEHSSASTTAYRPPSSPEVISSLISSLATISTDVEHHFNRLPRLGTKKNSCPSLSSSSQNTPTSIRAIWGLSASELSHRPPWQEGLSLGHGAYKQPSEVDEQSYLLEDTAYPPVVRMSKSSRSRSTTPILRRSQYSLRAMEENISVGQPGTEAGLQPPSPSLSIPRGSTLSRMISKRASKESLPTGRNERAEPDDAHVLSPLSIKMNHSRSPSSLKEDVIDETAVGWQSPPASPLKPARRRYSGITPMAANKSPGVDRPASVGSGRVIPSRRSSLNHAAAVSPTKKSPKALKQNHTAKHSTKGQDVSDEEDSTLRRIRELQKQKQRREKEQRREERRRERKSSSSMLDPASLRRASDQGSRHVSSALRSKIPSEPNLSKDRDAKRHSVCTDTCKRDSIGPPPSTPSISSQPTVDPSNPRMRPSLESRPVIPDLHPRTLPGAPSLPGRPSSGADRPRSPNSIHDAVEAYVNSPLLTQRLRHPESGRVIAFSEVGHPRGYPVICCVGMGMTRYIMAFYDELAITLRLRLITIDRPGVGESQACPHGTGTPLNWPDDVSIVCNALSISKFSLIAHSAGAVYALATALRLPHQVRGRLHLMGAWIPPSQITSITSHNESTPSSSVPYTQKLLRVLPESLLKAANSSLMSSTTSSMSHKPARRSRRKSLNFGNTGVEPRQASPAGPQSDGNSTQPATFTGDISDQNASNASSSSVPKASRENTPSDGTMAHVNDGMGQARHSAYEFGLTQRIWDLAQRRANPAVDLLICIERRQEIGFRYVDITRPCVFHHGSRDSRVPIENVKWLAKKMRRSEVRTLEREGHSLMANAKVMGGVLTEVAHEWEDWARVTREGRRRRAGSDMLDG